MAKRKKLLRKHWEDKQKNESNDFMMGTTDVPRKISIHRRVILGKELGVLRDQVFDTKSIVCV